MRVSILYGKLTTSQSQFKNFFYVFNIFVTIYKQYYNKRKGGDQFKIKYHYHGVKK